MFLWISSLWAEWYFWPLGGESWCDWILYIEDWENIWRSNPFYINFWFMSMYVFMYVSWYLCLMNFIELVQIYLEREKIMSSNKYIMPAAFVSFKTRWGAAVCAQTQQSRNPTEWLTEWAPEPRDIYWANLAIPYVSLAIRRLIIAAAFFFLTFFFMIPIALVQSLANIEGIEKALPFLKPVIELWVALESPYLLFTHYKL